MEILNTYINTADKKGIILPRCGICNQVPEEGIRGGLIIKKAFICNKCQNKMINIDVGSPEYEVILNKIKKIFK